MIRNFPYGSVSSSLKHPGSGGLLRGGGGGQASPGSKVTPTQSWPEKPGGGDREGPSPPGPINSISWVEPGGPNI